MNFRDLQTESDWIPFSEQMDRNVTYVWVKNSSIRRLSGESDILYIGKTEQAVRSRFVQETRTNNTPNNSQLTNIRMTHVFRKIGLENSECFFIRKLDKNLAEDEKRDFLERLRTWDKGFYLKIAKANPTQQITIPFEKYLLVMYADDHLEVPPMNNSFWLQRMR